MSDVAISLSDRELAVYGVLAEHQGQVVSRHEIARRAGLRDLHPRRCDSLISSIRRQLGDDHLVTVRQRGWMLVTGN